MKCGINSISGHRHAIRPRIIVHSLCLLAALALLAAGGRPAAAIEPGKYVRERGTGTLVIEKMEDGRASFSIVSVGDNGHTCTVDGTINGNEGRPKYDDSGCRISFVGKDAVLTIPPLSGECDKSNYCGMRASFDGEYRIPPPDCTTSARQIVRDRFITQYKSRNFQKARAALEGLLEKCSFFIRWIAMDDIRNDLALAQFHDGDPNACLTTLSATYAGRNGEDDFFLPPVDMTDYERVARATWHNQALCRKATTTARPDDTAP
ncbi:MAG: hypothetical protein LBP68_02575 [Acidobacteriota bacterium]|nr:hypothetical protein [Acidobacteriota bacterium]